MLKVHMRPVLNDNYIFVIEDTETKSAICIDPATASVVNEILEANNLTLTHVLNTHHHYDHVGGNLELKRQHNCQIAAYTGDVERIPGCDLTLTDSSIFKFGKHEFEVIYTPGHTLGHVSYYCQQEKLLFCGDTLFSIGCGRLFEGSPEQMWSSLSKLKSLDPATLVYCTHEYTLSNLKFALSIAPKWPGLAAYNDRCLQMRAKQKPTIPTSLELEMRLNPFLLCDNPEFQQTLGMHGKSSWQVLKQVRSLKDNF